MRSFQVTFKSTFKSTGFLLPSSLLLLALFGPAALAFDSPVRRMDLRDADVLNALGYGGPPQETLIVPVSGARVVLADYALIKRDFPQVENFSASELDAWLIQEGAWMSVTQVALGQQAGIHNEIPYVQAVSRIALRPRSYGRALVLDAYVNGEAVGLFDAKGTGAFRPQNRSHGNGLAGLAEMIREFAMQKLVHAVFVHSQMPYSTVESYAVLDLGFSFQNEFGEKHRAAIILRQAHLRHPARNGLVAIDDLHDKIGRSAMRAEMVLQHYGVTSSAIEYNVEIENAAKAKGAKTLTEIGMLDCAGCNIQGFFGDPDRNAVTVVDFGTYTALNPMNFRYTDPYGDLPSLFDKPMDYSFPYEADPLRRVSIENWGIEPIDPTDLSKGLVDHLGDWASHWASWLGGQKAIASQKTFEKRRQRLEASLAARLAAERAHWAAADAAEALEAIGLEPVQKKSKH